jgi:hypothetical protein
VPAEAIEFPQREIVNLIQASNYTPTNQDMTQLAQATRSQFLNFCVDSGAVNALSVALNPALPAYKQGMPLHVLVANNNTGPSVINVNSLGQRPIVRPNGSQLSPGDLSAGMIAHLIDDGTRYQLINFQGASSGGGTVTNTYLVHIPYAVDTSSIPNQIIASYTPAITSMSAGDLILVKVANVNTGATTIAINALSPQPVRRNDGQPLQGGDLNLGEGLLLEWNVSYWQVLRMVRSQVFFKLTADLTIYVRPDGNDLNDGSANDPAHAFQTIQAAANYIANSFIIGGFKVTIQLGIPGTYPCALGVQIGLGLNAAWISGALIIAGDPANKSQYVIQGPPTGSTSKFPCIGIAGSGMSVTLSGFTINARRTDKNMIDVSNQAYCAVKDLAFTGVNITSNHIAAYGAQVNLYNVLDFYNSAGGSIGGYDCNIEAGLWYTVLHWHGCSFSTATVGAAGNAYIALASGWCTMSGSAFGTRYTGFANAAIVTYGGPNYIPGSSPGNVDPSSVYY